VLSENNLKIRIYLVSFPIALADYPGRGEASCKDRLELTIDGYFGMLRPYAIIRRYAYSR